MTLPLDERGPEMDVAHSPISGPSERDLWLETMADYDLETNRKFAAYERRIRRLESRAQLVSMTDEMKAFLVMTGISLACAIFVPLIQGAIEKWRRH